MISIYAVLRNTRTEERGMAAIFLEAVRLHSAETDLVIAGLPHSQVQRDPISALSRDVALNGVLFVNASERIPIL